MSKDVSPSVKTVEEEEPMCSICCGELTVKNIVNPECGHATCKDCFWRWAKDKNSCPFCRTNLLKNTEEAQEIQQMRNLLEHRTRIVRQVESAYDEEDRIKADVRRLKRNVGAIRSQVLKFEQLKKEEHKKLMEIKKANGGTYQTFKYFKEQIVEMMCKDRRNREKIDEASMNLAHGDKGMCLEVLRDIKILGRSRPQRWKYGWFCQPMLGKVREMNKVRGDRERFRRKRDIFNEWGAFQGLDRLFREEETFVTGPVRHNLEQAFVEYISTLDNNTNPRINAEHFLNNVIQGLLDNSNNIISDPFSDNNIPNNSEDDSMPELIAGSDSDIGDMPELEAISDSDMSIDSDDYIPELE